jgi:phenylpyruvate tautomerase PptA (4-oxalocrotonate tautomerase family)
MPLIDVHVIKDVFNQAQKKEIIEKITNTMVEIEGEALRGVTWVRIRETKLAVNSSRLQPFITCKKASHKTSHKAGGKYRFAVALEA